MKNTFLVLLPALFMLSCSDHHPLPVFPYALDEPSSAPLIDRDSLIHDNSFQTAYLNGTIRSTRALIHWKQSTDADFLCYRIFRNTTTLIGTIDSVQRSWIIDSMLVQDSWYQYSVLTVLRNGMARTDTITIRTPKFLPPLPGMPRVDTAGGIMLTWTGRAESVQEYSIDRKVYGENELGYQRIADHLPASATSFIDLLPGNSLSYVYRLIARNAFEPPAGVETYPVLYLMSAPTLYAVDQIGASSAVRVKFIDNSNAEAGFRIYRSSRTAARTLVGRAPANATQFIDTVRADLAADSVYTYEVECYNGRHSQTSSRMTAYLRRPTIGVSASELQFPKTFLGTSALSVVTIRNTGGIVLTVSDVVSSNPHFYPDRRSFTIPVGGAATLLITFTPTDTLVQQGVVTIVSDAATGAVAIPATAVGTGAGPSTGSILKEGFEGGMLPDDWTATGSPEWFVQNNYNAMGSPAYEGSYCARSGMFPNNTTASLSKTVFFIGPKVISFKYRASTSSTQNYLKFSINGVDYGRWTGYLSWQAFAITYVGSGPVTLTWTYHQEAAPTPSYNGGWIDNVEIQ